MHVSSSSSPAGHEQLSNRNVNNALKAVDLKSRLASCFQFTVNSGANAPSDIMSIKRSFLSSSRERSPVFRGKAVVSRHSPVVVQPGRLTGSGHTTHKRPLTYVTFSGFPVSLPRPPGAGTAEYIFAPRSCELLYPTWGYLLVVQWYWSRTEVAPCGSLTPILHLSDVESLFLLRLFRVATTGRERAQRDVPPPPPTAQHPSAGGWIHNSIFLWRISSISPSSAH